jgi:hypothetical protein
MDLGLLIVGVSGGYTSYTVDMSLNLIASHADLDGNYYLIRKHVAVFRGFYMLNTKIG